MTVKIDQVIAAMAQYVAHDRGWSLQDATAWVRQHMIEARAEYRAAGAPLGDTEQGFLA
jgi:hypothetical protein